MTRWQIYPDVGAFLQATQAFLMSHEALNNMILSSATRLIQNAPPVMPIFAAYRDEQNKIAGAILAACDRPILATNLPAEAAEGLAELLKGQPRFDVMAPEPAATIVAQALQHLHGRMLEARGFHLHLWKKSPQVEISPGQMRRAWIEDTEPLLKWTTDFAVTTGVAESVDDSAKLLQQMIVNRRLFVWADQGEIVSMAAFTGPTLNGVRINTVYTPVEKRKRGYARSLTLRLSELQKQLGKSFCVLFTDPSNPTSNKIYREIGYEPLGLFTHYLPAGDATAAPAPTGGAG